MIIDLPDTFCYKDKLGHELASINGGETLELMRDIAYADVMYAITYKIKGHKCVYCGRTLKEGKTTLDHVIPRDLGGPTIPNNLVPACPRCNAEKSNMTEWEYIEYLKLGIRERAQFFSEVIQRHERIKFKIGFKLPHGWVQIIPVSEIQVCHAPQNVNLKKIEEFYEKFGNLKKPIIIDRNGMLMEEYRIFLFAKKMHLDSIPAIVLENVHIRS